MDEIGHLGTPGDQRTSVQLGRTEIVLTDSRVRFQGRDDDGHAWQASLPVHGGIGFTTVWQADFDRNSRPDLLIAAYFPTNGRCLDEVTLSFLLFDMRGQPVPWVIRTRMPHSNNKFPSVPAIFTELDRVAGLIVTDCEYSNPPRLGEDRRITGIYEARNAMWNLTKPADLSVFTALVRKSHDFRPQFDMLLPSNPAEWLDQGNDLQAQRSVRLAVVLPRSEACRGTVRLPPVVNGQLQADAAKNPCEELGRERIKLTDGTVCYGWPAVVLDGRNGREIVAERDLLLLTLSRVIEQQRAIVLTGKSDQRHCSPTLLWALAPSGSPVK